MKQQIYNTGIYLRLSCDDDVHGESVSISNQRQMLTQYCREHGLRLVDEYVDDGYSGTNFDRPSFQRMLDDIENGKINCVVTKDLSRLGRNYILTGQYTEIYFPSKNVRYIAVSDGVDSEKGESEIAPFLNILNEMHARQTSKKVKAAMKVRFENGARSGYCAPYGYLKHESIKGKIVPDEETAWVVRKIFTLAATGLGPNKIRRALESEKIPSPSWRQYEKFGFFSHLFEGKPENQKYLWTNPQIGFILKDETYIGHSIHYRRKYVSFKNKKQVLVDENDWYRVENTHEPLISMDLWEQVQAHVSQRKRSGKSGRIQIFAGLLRCADCKSGMRLKETKYKDSVYRSFECSTYGQYGKERCTNHLINYKTLYNLVLIRLQQWVALAHKDEKELLDRLLKNGQKQRDAETSISKKELAKAVKRQKELDTMFAKLYEDHAMSRIDERNYDMLRERYQDEQRGLDEKIAVLNVRLAESVETQRNAERWIALIQKYTVISELTAPLLHELIEKIVIHQGVTSPDGFKDQEVEIFYRFIGKIEF